VITKAIESDPLGEKGTTVENKGLQACLSAGIASCATRGAAPTCSNGREVFCGEGQPVCEQKHKSGCDDTKANCLYDVPVCRVQIAAEPGKLASSHVAGLAVCPSICEMGPIGKPRLFAINEVCHGTGIWLEEGQKYEITMLPPDPGEGDYQSVAWRDDDGSIVSTRGKTTTGIWAKVREALLWPLKRHLFNERFKVIARVGSVGSDERVLEADDDPKSHMLNVQIKPKRSGELFLYVNEAVWGWPSLYGYFYDGNSGQATVVVQRPRRAN
jgi:hypothetical protein